MAISNPVELAARNNPLPKSELPALIHAMHSAVERLEKGLESAPLQIEAKAPAVPIRKSITPDFLICLDDGKRFKSLRRHLAGLGLTPEQLSREMEPAARLSHGRAQLCGAAIRVSEKDRTWPGSGESRRSQIGFRSEAAGRTGGFRRDVSPDETPTRDRARILRAVSPGVRFGRDPILRRQAGRDPAS